MDALSASGRLSRGSVRNVYSTLRALFRDAALDELVQTNPCCLPRGVAPAVGRFDASRSRRASIFTREEAHALWTDPRIPADRRMFYALLLFTGMRHGEAAGRRWRDLDEGSLPLSALAVSTQYEDVPLKTGVPRVVPVHGSLAALLTHWRFSGFERFLGRPPSLDDFIVPSRLARCRAAGTTRRNLQRDCRTIAVTPRRTHDTRHTFISHARRDGARSDVLQRITHNARCDVLDQYTHVEWEPLCEAVSRLRL